MEYKEGVVFENSETHKKYVVLVKKEINGTDYLLCAPYVEEGEKKYRIVLEFLFAARINKEDGSIIPDSNEKIINELVEKIYK